MNEDFNLLYDDDTDDTIDFHDDWSSLEEQHENHQVENEQTMPTMNASPIFENDPNGGVIVTDIFGGEHHYMNMEQAQALTDFMSGSPIATNSTSVPDSPSNAGQLPTDIHTPNDLSFYDDKLQEARHRLDQALDDATHSTNARELEDALSRQKQAEKDIDYWKGCRSQADYNQTIEHLKSDKIINDCNDALNKLHDILHNNK